MLIVGSGALATFFAERLDACDRDFQIFCPSSVRAKGLAQRFGESRVATIVGAIRSYEKWLVCLKSWQNQAKASLLQKAPFPRAILVVENGLAPEEVWARAFPARVERALCTYGVRMTRPGRVHSDGTGEICLAPRSAFTFDLRNLGLNCREDENFETAVWKKLAVNASLNVVATLFDLNNGAALRGVRTRELMRRAALEVESLARTLGVDWEGPSGWELAKRVAQGTHSNICSTLADVREGRRSEYEAINGAILEKATEVDCHLPTLRALDRAFRLVLDGRQVYEFPGHQALGPVFSAKKSDSPLPKIFAELSYFGAAHS